MSEIWDNELLKEIGNAFASAGMDSEIEDFDGKSVLVIEFGDENSAEDCNISVEHFTDDTVGISVMFSIALGLDEKQSDDVMSLLPYLNKYLSVGSFGIMMPDGYFSFGSSFVIDEDEDRASVLKMTAATFDICSATVNEAVELIAPVINGDKPVSELMNEETAIIQF